MEQLIEKYNTLLNEEKWTRATINNYTIKNFEDLNDLITQFEDNHIQNEILEITKDYLTKNKNSIIALYVSTIFQAKDGRFEDDSAYNLIKIFSDNIKWNIVEYLCIKISEYLKDKIIIRHLIEALNNQNKKEQMYQYWEELIKVDYEESAIVIKLADKKLSEGKQDEAISYYKKACNRTIHNKNFSQLEEVWKKLLTFDEVSYDFYLNLEKKVSKSFSVDKTIELFFLVYEKYKKAENWDISIKILKTILDFDTKNEKARNEIVFCYRNKYKDHSHLEEYIKKSNLDESWRTASEAIATFEKHIAFDKGNFVYHRDFGIGVIKDIIKDDFVIDFQKSKNHKMSLKLALTSLKVLPKNHIWILKLKNIDRLRETAIKDPVWVIKVLIKSYDNKIKMKDIKQELVPDVLKASEWTSWWNTAKRLMRDDPTIGTTDENEDIYELRDKPISIEEKTTNLFKASKDFFQRFNIAYQYFSDNEDPDSDLAEMIISYFSTFLKSTENVNEQTMISFLFLSSLSSKFNYLNIQIPFKFSDYLENINDPIEIYEKIGHNELKNQFLLFYKQSYKNNWQETFIRFFYTYPNSFIFQELQNSGQEYVKKLISNLISAYKEYREAYFWIVSKIIMEDPKLYNSYDTENIILSLFHLIELAGKDVSIKKDVTKNKKIITQIKDFLFKNNFIHKYIEKSTREFCKRLYVIVSELISLEAEYKVAIKDKISSIYPDIDVDNIELTFDESKKTSSILEKLLTTRKSYEEKTKELHYISEVEIPQNSKDIGEAMEKGDLRENAEFKAAKERQEFLRNRLTKLSNDLAKAVVVEKKDVSTDFITFGTKVTLYDKIANKDVVYTILGPWESNTDQNIISYQSPLGIKLLDKVVNDEINFTLNDQKYSYKVKKIEYADF